MTNVLRQAKNLVDNIKKIKKYNNYILFSLVILLSLSRLLNNIILINFIFVLYLFISTIIWSDIFKKFFNRNKNIVDYLYGLFISFFLPIIFSAIFIIYGYINNISWLFIFILSSVATILFKKNYKIKNNKQKIIRSKVLFRKNILPIVVIIMLSIIALALMVSGNIVTFSPWNILPVEVIYISFGLLLLSGLLVYSQWSYKYILLLLMLVSVVMHSNLAKSHDYPWGGDVWRMIGVEERLADGNIVEPVLFGSEIKYKNIVGVSIPEAFVIPHKYAYGHMWASVVLIAEHSNISILNINKWLLPIMWPIFVTSFLYQIGLLLFRSRRSALLLCWASLLPFTFQVLGAITLPNSFGFIYFLFVFSLILKDVQKKSITFDYLVLFLLGSSLFGYSLYAIILWALYIGVWLFKYIENQVILEKVNFKFKALYLGLSLGLAAYLMPLIDVALKTTYISVPLLPQGILSGSAIYLVILEKLKLFVGQSSGLFISKFINPSDTLSWNILFNHVPDYAFVNNMFTSFRWHVLVVVIIILLSVIFGVYKFLRNKDILESTKYLLFMLAITSLIGYIFGWHILEGDRTFVRRLDGLVGLVFIIFSLFGITNIYKLYASKIENLSMDIKRILYIFIIIIFSWFGTTVYALGPDMRSTSEDEYVVGNFVSSLINLDEHTCVVANTEILLVIESQTKANIVGGNFDIDYQFGQRERVEILDKLYSNDRSVDHVAKQIFKEHRFNNCYVILDGKKLQDKRISELLEIFGDPIANKSLFSVWSVQSIDFLSQNK